MGCDIHERMFLYSKGMKRYFDVDGVEFTPMRDIVCPILENRYYDFFGVMGNRSRSGSYGRMRCLLDGVPDCLGNAMDEDLDIHDHYGFVSSGLQRFEGGIREYKGRLDETLKCMKRRFPFCTKRNVYNPRTGRYSTSDVAMSEYFEYILESIENLRKTLNSDEFRLRCELAGLSGFDVSFRKSILVWFFDN